MTRIDVQRTRGGASWLWWLILGLALLALIILLWLTLSDRRAELAPVEEPAVETPAGLDLNQVLEETDLPRQFTYGGMTWQAVGAGRYDLEGRDLIAIGPDIGGNELYYEQGTPTNPYQTLYLRGETEGYRDVYVMYEPVEEGQQ